MRLPVLVLTAMAAGAGAAWAQGAAPALSADTAEKMATACIAYAMAHNGAVNIWIYDANGEVLHFHRMDGAPPVLPLTYAGTDLGGGLDLPDPTVFDPLAPGAVPVTVGGRVVGTARAEGMGSFDDHTCANAAAAVAAKPAR